MESDIREMEKAWEQEITPALIKAATKDWDEYSPSVQAIIESEARRRGLWEKVLYLRSENPEFVTSTEGNLEGYVCELCKGTYLNPETGRCGRCNLQAEGFGYCRTCDRFFSISPDQLCPEDRTKLIWHTAATALLRFGNLIFDAVILRILVFPTFFMVSYVLAFLGLFRPDSWEEIDPSVEWIIGLSYVFLYYFIFEAIWQRTPGKFLTGTKVITCDGTKPKANTIALRTLTRFIPFQASSFLGDKVYGWHDSWSGTYVIKSKRFERKKIAVERSTAVEKEPPSITALVERECGKEKESEIWKAKHAEVASQNFKAEKPLTSVESEPMMSGRLEKCSNCKRIIGKLEHTYMIEGNIVCVKCYQVLNSDHN